jgi:hypothetical protein
MGACHMTRATETTERLQCNALVYKRDTYRVSRISPSGFKMHYNRCQCARFATCAEGLCRQHASVPGGVMLWSKKDHANAR